MTVKYRVRDFADFDMQNELAATRDVLDWGWAWNRLHHSKAPAPEGTVLTVIEQAVSGGWKIVERNYAGGRRSA